MKPPSDEAIAEVLAGRPEGAIDPRFSTQVARRARLELARGGERRAEVSALSRLWAEVVLPAVLLVSAVAYGWASIAAMGRIFAAPPPAAAAVDRAGPRVCSARCATCLEPSSRPPS